MIGKTISHYEITEELGRGGMGIVYKAQDTKLKRTVALKFLSPHLLTDPDQKARFLHEAQAAAVLEHPNISTIHEIHEADGHTFMVMAFIEGEDVGAKMKPGPMAVDEALDIIIQVAKGLSKAHSEGIVHRDIKPGNVLITSEGHAKVVDFGLAKLATQTKLTKTGITMGTVRYMSPEQARGDDVDHRTDIWSLGVMLYEMLAGRIPFRGDMEPAMMYSIMNEDPEPITSTRKDIPVALEDIIEKTLAKDPAKRYQTMEELLTELERQRDQIALGIKEKQFTAWRRLKRRKRLTTGVAIAVAIVAAAVLIQTFHSKNMAIDSVAVLPFTNLSGVEEQEYFSDGMTESLINEIGQIRALRVISRTSVMQFKKTDKSLKEIANALDVDAVVEASVLRTGDRIRITARLIRAEPEELLWSESYNREERDAVILLSEVTRAIADRIEIALTPQEEERLTRIRTVDPAAHDAYLKGRHQLVDKWTEEGMKKGIRHYMDAIDVDPTYALAYAGLAYGYSTIAQFGFMPEDEAMKKARAAAKKAVELDPSLGLAHAMLGWIRFTVDWDWYGPEEDFRRAVELDPSNPDIRSWYAHYLTYVGRHEEAIRHCEKEVELDPLTSTTALHLAYVYEYAGRYDEVIEVTRKAIEMDPNDPYGMLQLAGGYFGKGMYAETVSAIDSAFTLLRDPDDQVMLFWAGWGYGGSGRKDKAEEILHKLLALSERRYVEPLHIAMVYQGLGRTDEMFEWLEKEYDIRAGGMMSLRVNFGKYRDDPRYIDLCRRIGIPLDG